MAGLVKRWLERGGDASTRQHGSCLEALLGMEMIHKTPRFGTAKTDYCPAENRELIFTILNDAQGK